VYISTPGKLEKYAWPVYTTQSNITNIYSPVYIIPTQKIVEKYYNKTSVEVLSIIVNRIKRLGNIIEASLSMFSASFLPWFMQEMVGSLSRVYRIFDRTTNSYVFI
jgi:hypothetical protein